MNDIIAVRTNNLKSVPAMCSASGYMTKHRRLDMNILTDKRCSKCGEVKPVSQFSKAATKKSGYASYCKTCFNATYGRTEKERERSKRRRQENPERVAFFITRWQKEHPDKVRKTSLKWRNNNLEKAREGWHKFIASLPVGWDAARKREAYAADPEKARTQGIV